MPTLRTTLLAGLLGSVAAIGCATAQTATTTPPAVTAPATPAPVAPAPAIPAPAASPVQATPPATAQAVAKPVDASQKAASEAQTRMRDRVAFFRARIAALHAGLLLDADQQKLWPPLEQAIQDLARARYQEGRVAREGRKAIDDETAPATGTMPFDLLKQSGEAFERHGKALQALASAAQPLYASLTDEQKHRLPHLLEGLVPNWGPNARLLTMLNLDGARNHGEDRDADRGTDHGDHNMDRSDDRGDDRSYDRGGDGGRDRMSDEEGGHAWHHRHHRDWDREERADHGGADMDRGMDHHDDRGSDDHADWRHHGQDSGGRDED